MKQKEEEFHQKVMQLESTIKDQWDKTDKILKDKESQEQELKSKIN